MRRILNPMTQLLNKYRFVPTAPPLPFLILRDDSDMFDLACDGCGVSPIRGLSWKCSICDDFYFCQECSLSMKQVGDHQADHPMIQVHEEKLLSTRTPTDLSGSTSLIVPRKSAESSLVWPRLECFTLRYRAWETRLLEGEIEHPHPPMAHQTWLALERTLPALESLGLSICLIPFGGQPLPDILLRIKHLSLFDNNTVHIVDSTRPGYIAYLTSCLMTISVQLRQLESFRLSLMDESAVDKEDRIWTNLPFNECLAPLILSSNNLRHLIIDAPNIKPAHSQFEEFESIYQNQLFRLFGLWKLFQPSFEPPLNCNSIRHLLYPLLALEAQPLYDVAFVEKAAQHQQNTSKPTVTPTPPNPQPTTAPISQLTTTISSSVNGFVSSYVNGWKSHLNQWLTTPSEADLAREIKRLQSIHDRANLFERICTSLNSRRDELFQQHPHLTFQPRTFRITMETHLVSTNSSRLWK